MTTNEDHQRTAATGKLTGGVEDAFGVGTIKSARERGKLGGIADLVDRNNVALNAVLGRLEEAMDRIAGAEPSAVPDVAHDDRADVCVLDGIRDRLADQGAKLGQLSDLAARLDRLD